MNEHARTLPKPIGALTLFGAAFAVGLLTILAYAGYLEWRRPPPLATHFLSNSVQVAAQLNPSDLPQVVREGFTLLVDLRPDGEATDQPSAAQMSQAASKVGLRFAYVPVPHGNEVPEQAVGELSRLLATNDGAVLLYCRSGRRAVRTWSLAEASMARGAQADVILDSARAAGQPVEDLSAQIQARVAARPQTGGVKP